MRHTQFSVLATLLSLTMLAGCAPSENKKGPEVFYPDPPDLARIQYLTSFNGVKDLQKTSAFEKFIVGKENTGTLDKPYGVAMFEGKIYVCDTNATVMVFDLKEKTFGQLQGAQGMGKLVQPINISLGPDGTKYVADAVREQILVYDKNDFYVRAYSMGVPGEWRPVDAAAFEDRVYVADTQNGEIKVFDKQSGKLVKRFGKDGDPTEWLQFPTNLAFDSSGYLYVSDTGRFQIVKYDRDGHVIGRIGEMGREAGTFSRPRGIAVDRQGRLYAVDAAFDNVQLFDKQGKLLLSFAKAGITPGDLYLPAKIAIDYGGSQYFRQYIDPNFEAEYIILVTSQFGDKKVNVYAFGQEKGKRYPTDEELQKELDDKIKKYKQEHPEKEEKKAGEETKKSAP